MAESLPKIPVQPGLKKDVGENSIKGYVLVLIKRVLRNRIANLLKSLDTMYMVVLK